MRALVTGAAGFIGSHLTERLLADGWKVVGIDSFTDYYEADAKKRNLMAALASADFRLEHADLLEAELEELLDGMDVVFHLAGQPGVRGSWGEDFRIHAERNVMATQRVLEAARRTRPSKLVFASSSSVYGDGLDFPTTEDSQLRPVSPYGVSKLAAEKLCFAYGQTFGLPIVAVRYFTVYGPRQRPDMAFHRFINWIHEGQQISLFGDGSQQRDFTYVGDAVAATISAGVQDVTGEAINVGGGNSVTVSSVLGTMSELMDLPAKIKNEPTQDGDVKITCADISRARKLLDYDPSTSLRQGLQAQVEYQLSGIQAGSED